MANIFTIPHDKLFKLFTSFPILFKNVFVPKMVNQIDFSSKKRPPLGLDVVTPLKKI